MATIHSSNVVLFYFDPKDPVECFTWWFYDTVNEAMLAINEKINYQMNVVTDSKGTIFGHAYIRIDNKKFINILEDKQPNGKPRITKEKRIVEDPESWGGFKTVEVDVEVLPAMRFYPMYHNVFPTYAGLAKIKPVEADKQHNVIFSTWDGSINTQQLFNVFKPYSTSIDESYPKINCISKSSLVFVTFDPKTHDGQSAMLVQRKTVIRDKVMFFSFAKIR